jgi:hypothetical protein
MALVMVLAVGGCTGVKPASIADFGAEKKVVVTYRDGETIAGHIDEGEQVTFTTFGRVYVAEVESVSDNGDIVLARPYLQEEYEQFGLQRQRMENSTLHITDETESIAVPAYKIVQVEEVTFDRMRSARAAGFWGFTIFVVSQVLSARL